MKKVTFTIAVEGQGEEFDFTVATMKLLVKQTAQSDPEWHKTRCEIRLGGMNCERLRSRKSCEFIFMRTTLTFQNLIM